MGIFHIWSCFFAVRAVRDKGQVWTARQSKTGFSFWNQCMTGAEIEDFWKGRGQGDLTEEYQRE